MVATVKLERRNPMLQMLLRSSDIMQSILVDINASLHPPDLRIRMNMPQYRVESFKDFEDIVAIGEKTAEATLAARGGWEFCMALGRDAELAIAENGGSAPALPAPWAPAAAAKSPRLLAGAVARAASRRGTKPGRPPH